MKMISQEQKELSDYIKSVHVSLRCKSKELGAELAWKEHVENEEVLSNYAIRMKKLAENYWSVNNKRDNGKFLCRIEWMSTTIREYFDYEKWVDELTKENNKIEHFKSKSLILENELKYCNTSTYAFIKPYKLLDVGSCYDPFSVYEFLQTFPIDLCPASSSVKKCDFTKLKFQDTGPQNWSCDDLQVLQKNYFDIVAFSLFLEYLPSPELRYLSCEKAYEALKPNGLLLIATPDSKHETANAKLMKNWKIALAQIGYVRVKFEKLKYMYCMAFRKAINRTFPVILNKLEGSDRAKMIHIPQDFVDYKVEKISVAHTEVNEQNVKEIFDELPFL